MESTTSWEDRATKSSVGELVGEVMRDLSLLMRQEIQLAKAELRESANETKRGAGLLGGAAYAASTALLFVSIAAWWALGDQIGLGWSAIVVAAVWALVAVGMYLSGRKAIGNIKGAPDTVETLKKIPDTLKKGED